jgi:hypothetical protein
MGRKIPLRHSNLPANDHRTAAAFGYDSSPLPSVSMKTPAIQEIIALLAAIAPFNSRPRSRYFIESTSRPS